MVEIFSIDLRGGRSLGRTALCVERCALVSGLLLYYFREFFLLEALDDGFELCVTPGVYRG